MGTRANIQIIDDRGDTYHVYRGHDGSPENVLRDLRDAALGADARWSGSGAGLYVALLLSMTWTWQKDRLPVYEMTTGVHGDESYLYSVTWENDPAHGGRKRWVARVRE